MEKAHTLADVESMELAKVPLAVFGKPITHSLSPLMQNAALDELSQGDPRFCGWHYYKFEVDPKDLGAALKVFHSKGFKGINLTIPHKEIVFDHLEGADAFARLAGAANTLVRTDSGWYGTNTDGYGLEKALYAFSRRSLTGSDIVVLGAGGAARAACFYAAQMGAKSIAIANRTKLKSQCIVEEVRLSGFECISEFSDIKPASIIINATSLGLSPEDAPVLDFSKISKDCVFFDMPYIRGMETPSVRAARENGLCADSGLAMLAWQGAKSLSIWTQTEEILGETMLNVLKAQKQ